MTRGQRKAGSPWWDPATGRSLSKRKRAGAALTAVMSLAACGSSEPEPEVDLSRVISSYSEVVLPLDAYGASNRGIALEVHANSILVRDCMARFGLDWAIIPAPDSDESDHDSRYGILDPDRVERYGYHKPPSPSLPDGFEEPTISPVQDRVLTGAGGSLNGLDIPPGGCAGEANRKLGEGVPAGAEQAGAPGLVLRLGAEAYDRAENDSRVRAVWQQWSDCMRERGYEYGGPWDAHDDPRWGGETASTEEIVAASADLACRQSTNLVGVWYAVEYAYQERLISENAEALRAAKLAADARAENVAAVLAEHGE